MTDFTRVVRNRSSRQGAPIRLLALHTTEGHNRPGVSDLDGLAGWFNNPDAQASSHLGIDQEGNCVRMVPDGDKAWTQAYWNPWCLSIEQVGFAAEKRQYWVRDYHKGLERVAQALATWSVDTGVPLRSGAVSSSGNILRSGVIQHSKLGSLGGGHHDCGDGYPQRYVVLWARLFKLRRTRPKGWKVRAWALKKRLYAAQRRYAGRVLGTT